MRKAAFLLLILLLPLPRICIRMVGQKAEGLPHWVTVPNLPDKQGYAVCYFRKTIDLDTVPQTLLVDVTADNRYKLYVNGSWVAAGPARSDRMHWYYDTIDIAPYLHTGSNIIVAQVWNQGQNRALSIHSVQTAFYLKSHSPAIQSLNTDDQWMCIADAAYSPCSSQLEQKTYMVSGPGETVDMNKRVVGWKELDCDMSNWQQAQIIFVGIPYGFSGYSFTDRWILQPSPLPQQEHFQEQPLTVRSSSVPESRGGTWEIPANTKAEILLDQTYLTNAYFSLTMSGGRGSSVVVNYQESLYEDFPRKGNRNEIAGKQFIGRSDSIIADGSEGCLYTTCDWRTYRYILLRITTGNQALKISDVQGTFTGYPLQINASLQTSEPEIQKIFQVGWRTARLCAADTYMDCPYYEQLQYFGDSRIQALITLYNSGDDTLAKNALRQAHLSRLPEGLTQSRYPSSALQLIPPYSLIYIQALHDYMMLGADQDFVKEMIPGTRDILNYFSKYQLPDGRLSGVPFWNFTDWVYDRPTWKNGEALPGADGCNAVMDLQLLLALTAAQELERAYGMQDYVILYEENIKKLRASIRNRYWDETRQLYADRSEHDAYSQHANALALLAGMSTGKEALAIAKNIEGDTTLTPASIYFKYYTHEAMIKAGLGDSYLNWLEPWRENLRLGLTTWAETSDVPSARSDCHAWGASPNIEFFRSILGIRSMAPAFQEVLIEPHLGKLQEISGSMPHPKGKISVDYRVSGKHLNGIISLPDSIKGVLVWKDDRIHLHSGQNEFEL